MSSSNPESFALAVNANIHAQAVKRDIPIARLRERIGLSAVQWRMRRQGRIAWTLNEIQSLARELGMDPADLTFVNVAEFEAMLAERGQK